MRLAVNQNGRWAPHLAWMREAVRAGLVGAVHAVDISIHWDHGWIAGTPFEASTTSSSTTSRCTGSTSSRASASARPRSTPRAPAPPGRPCARRCSPQAIVAFDGGQAALGFDGAARFGAADRTCIAGSAGTLVSDGPSLSDQAVTLTTAAGVARPRLEGTWFREGFIGTMGELLSAIEDGARAARTARRGNLDALALVFAAIASSARGVPVAPGEVRSLAEARG